MADYISREAAIQTLRNLTFDLGDQTDIDDIIDDVLEFAISAVERLVPAADVRNVPNNKVHLCDSCKHEYPDCPASNVDMLFGDGVGNDNICCCKCYVADVRPVGEISDAVDEAIDFLNSVSDQMPYHVYSALFDLICGIFQNCGADMREVEP